MSAPQWHAFVGGVVTALTDAAAVGGAGIAVYDGQTVSGDDSATAIVVGGRFDDDDANAGDFQLEYRTDGGASASMDETLRVNCSLQTWLGDPDIATARATAFAVLEDVNDTLRAAPGLGLSALLWCHISLGDVRQQLDSGARVTVNFTITARAII